MTCYQSSQGVDVTEGQHPTGTVAFDRNSSITLTFTLKDQNTGADKDVTDLDVTTSGTSSIPSHHIDTTVSPKTAVVTFTEADNNNEDYVVHINEPGGHPDIPEFPAAHIGIATKPNC